MKIKIIVVALSIFLALIVSGCTDVEEVKEFISKNPKNTGRYTQDYTVVEMRNSEGTYECKVRAIDSIGVKVRSVGDKVYVNIENRIEKDVYIEKIEVRMGENRDFVEIEIDRIMPYGMGISFPLNTGESPDYFYEINIISVIIEGPPNE